MQGNDLALDMNLEGHLPFDGAKQLAFLGHVMDLADNNLFLQVKERIKADWFLDPWAGLLYDAFQKFHEKYSRVPLSMEELMGSEDIRKLETPKKLKIDSVEKMSRLERGKFGRDALSQELTDWMRCRIFHKSVAESARLFNGKQLGPAVAILEKTVKEFQTIHFDGEPPADWSDPKALVRIAEADYSNACTTGLKIFDRHLNPDAEEGALLRGDTTVLLAPTNIGKTTTLLTIARHNVVYKKKSVLFISLEGRQLDIQEKFWQCFLTKNKQEFRTWVWNEDPVEQERQKIQSSILKNFMTYIAMNRPGLTVEEVVSMIRHHQAHRKATNNGKGYDLLVVDYPAILTSEQNRGGKLEYRQAQDYIYRQFVQLGLDEKFHVLLAAQTNREGSKVNKNSGDEYGRLVQLEDIAESYAITNSATNLITINRSPEAQEKNRVTFFICKSRSSDTGWAVVCKSDFAKATSHGESMGGIAYRNSDSMNDRVDKWLANHLNQDIRSEFLHR